MKKKSKSQFIIAVAIIVFLIISISTSTFGQETFSVSGDIIFLEPEGQFIVQLKTFDELENREMVAQSERRIIVKPNHQQLQAKKVPFKFIAVPKGEYCVSCLHDLNSNAKKDLIPGVGISAEPYAFSGPSVFNPMWEDIDFKVDKNVNGIIVKF